MILTPYDLQLFLAVCKSDIAEINHVNVFIDDSQITKGLTELGPADNILLFGVLPDYGGASNEEEALMMDNGLDFLVLKKMVYSDITHQEFLDAMQETLLVTRKLVERVYQEKNDPTTCNQFYFLREGSEQIIPVWAKSGCNGYMVSFNLLTSL